MEQEAGTLPLIRRNCSNSGVSRSVSAITISPLCTLAFGHQMAEGFNILTIARSVIPLVSLKSIWSIGIQTVCSHDWPFPVPRVLESWVKPH